MCTVPKPFSKEFRDDVVRVARDREPGQTIKQIAADFGIAESCLRNWLRQADVEEGVRRAARGEEADRYAAARSSTLVLLFQQPDPQANLPGNDVKPGTTAAPNDGVPADRSPSGPARARRRRSRSPPASPCP